MSRATLIVFRDGVAQRDEEFGNSWGFCPLIWDLLCHKYRRQLFNDRPGWTANPITTDDWPKLWEAAGCRDDAGVSRVSIMLRPWERIVLEFTYDNAVVPRQHFEELARGLERFEDSLVPREPGRACHLSGVASRIRQLLVDETCANVDAVGMWGTSVSSNPFSRYDETEDKSIPYNWREGSTHFLVGSAR